MTPEAIITIIENKGVTVVISGLVIFLAYKYFASIIVNANNTNKEILETLNKINKFLDNGYCRDEDLNLLIKLRGRYVILEYKWIIVKYILNNNIKENLEIIKLEMKNYIDSSQNRSFEIFNKKASLAEVESSVKLINDTLVSLNDIIIPIFENLTEQEDKLNIIRVIENHFDKIESEFLHNFSNKG